MTVTFDRIAEDPALYLFDIEDDWVRLQEMTRDGFHRSIFLDNRIRADGRQLFRVPAKPLLEGYAGRAPPERPIGFIFHVAQCGSTLLARALDIPGRSLVLREPAALRSLGVAAGSDAERSDRVGSGAFQERLAFTLSMLGKRWDKDAPVIVKANVPVNFIAREVLELEGGTPAILLHFPLNDYVAAVLRTEAHGHWVESIFSEMRLGSSRWAAGAEPRKLAEKVALLWFAQMKAFEPLPAAFPQVRSLSAAKLFESPEATIAASAELFGVSLEPGEAGAIAGSEIFATYSKNPALDYDLEVREAREAEAKRRLSAEIHEAQAWARAARDRHSLVHSLASPLLGERIALLD